MFRKSLYLMTLPALLLFALFVFFPLIRGFTMSLTDWNGFSQYYSFVGLQNYGDLAADRRVLRAAANTLIIAGCDTTLQVVLGLLYALLLNHSGRLISSPRTTGRSWLNTSSLPSRAEACRPSACATAAGAQTSHSKSPVGWR